MHINKNYLILFLLFTLFVLMFYKNEENFTENLYNHFIVYHHNSKIRLGNNIGDGGYIIGLLENNNYDFYISAGVNDEESFSRDFINKFNFNKHNCQAFDGTIENYPIHYTNKITFIKKNIGKYNTSTTTNLHNILDNYNNIFIKMDIEGHEYDWISTLNKSQLNNIKQLVLEVHGVYDDSWDMPLKNKINCFNKLNETHYLIHVHGNNHGGINDYNIPETLELTYIRKNTIPYLPELNKTSLPDKTLDTPNGTHKDDYDLNFYPFVNK